MTQVDFLALGPEYDHAGCQTLKSASKVNINIHITRITPQFNFLTKSPSSGETGRLAASPPPDTDCRFWAPSSRFLPSQWPEGLSFVIAISLLFGFTLCYRCYLFYSELRFHVKSAKKMFVEIRWFTSLYQVFKVWNWIHSSKKTIVSSVNTSNSLKTLQNIIFRNFFCHVPHFVLLIVSRCSCQTLHCITAGSDWCPFSLLLVSNFNSLFLNIFASLQRCILTSLPL